MSEKPPKQLELIKLNELKKASRGLNLFKSTIKSMEASYAERTKKEEEEARRKAVDKILGRKKSPERGDQ